MLNEDNYSYHKFTGPRRLEKAIRTLQGIVEGITVDGLVSAAELVVLREWIEIHREFSHRHPFNEVIPCVDEMLRDGIFDDEEQADLLWLCRKFTDEKSYFNSVTSDMQLLQGMLTGIIADGIVTKEELKGLREWMGQHEQLRTCWPYDELESLIIAVMADGVIDETEHDQLLVFFSEFGQFNEHRALELRESKEPAGISGVCAMDPEIIFEGSRFCFTGRSERYTRSKLADEITRRGGLFSRSVTKDTNFLMIGADGNPSWAFACYGRKVEQAIEYRKTGAKLLLVHEYDLWDALEDSV